MVALTDFDIAYVIETLGAQEGLAVETAGIPDVCYGCVIGGDQTFTQFLQKHRLIYDYQILDGDPIRIVRRETDLDFSVDLVVFEVDCIRRTANASAIKFSRTDPLLLPRGVEIHYIDPDARFAVNSQVARHPNADFHQGILSLQTDFVHDAAQVRGYAYNILYQMWMHQLTVEFEHPNLNLEPGDVVHLVSEQGEYDIILNEMILTKERTGQFKGSALLSGKTLPTIAAGQRDPIDAQGLHHHIINRSP